MTEEGIDKKKIEFTPKEFEEVTKYLLGIRYQSVHVPQSGGLYYYICSTRNPGLDQKWSTLDQIWSTLDQNWSNPKIFF